MLDSIAIIIVSFVQEEKNFERDADYSRCQCHNVCL
jgi:hypothetical protein